MIDEDDDYQVVFRMICIIFHIQKTILQKSMFKKIHYALNWVSRKKVVCKVIFDQLVSYSVTKPDLGPVHHLRWKNSHKEHYLDVAGVLDQPLS